MIVSLEDAKLYLRVDGDEENTLITSFINAAEEMCEEIIRFPLTDFTEMPEVLRQAVLYAVANMYEQRENIDMKNIHDVMTRLLFSHRKESW